MFPKRKHFGAISESYACSWSGHATEQNRVCGATFLTSGVCSLCRPAVRVETRAMSTQSQRSFTIRRAASNDGEAIVACLTAAFAPYSNSYTPAAFTDTVLDPRLVQHRLREMCVFVAVLERKGGGAGGWAGVGGGGEF